MVLRRDLRRLAFLLTIESSRWERLLRGDTVIAASLLINFFVRSCHSYKIYGLDTIAAVVNKR